MLNFFRRLYDFIVSLRCAILILILLAISSILGTLFPQGMPDEAVFSQYGEGSLKAKLIIFFGINDLYHSGWFQFLLIALAVNIILCTIERIPKTLKLWSHTEKDLSPARLTKFSHSVVIKSLLNFDRTIELVKQCVGKTFRAAPEIVIASDDQWSCVLQKGKFSLFMVYGLHFTILVILFGAFLGSVLGFRGMMNIVEGASENLVRIAKKDRAIKLPFKVRCDDFNIEFYKDGTPKEYVSKISILKNNKKIASAEIKVNHPFTFEGITFYQATYGSLIKEADVTFIEPKTNKTFKLKLSPHKPQPLGNTKTMVHLLDFKENFSGFGPALAIAIMTPGQNPQGSWILAKFPKFHGNKIGKFRVVVDDFKTFFYTGLQVKRDPGVWIVIFGFIGFVLFLMATFYWNYRKLWITIVKGNDSWDVYVAGRTNKNQLAFEREFHRVCEELKKALGVSEVNS